MITIGDLIIDAALSETHTLDSNTTSFPVEDGADITDHVRKLPRVVEIEGIVSDTPIGRAGVVRAGVAALQEAGVIDTVPFSSEALTALIQIRDKREPITITTSLQLYDNMVMTALKIPRDAETGAVLRFSATFTEIVIVTNKRTRVRTAVPRGQRKGSRGTKPSKSVPTDSTYWCVEDRTVFIRPEDLEQARSLQKSTTAAVWTDWKQYPNPQYTQPLNICVVKKRVMLQPDGTMTTMGVDGKPRAMLPNEIAAAELDAQARLGVANLKDPIDASTGRPLSWTDKSTSGNKPGWNGLVDELLPDDGTTSEAAERARMEQYVRRAQGYGL